MYNTKITTAKKGIQISSRIYLLLFIFIISCSGQNKKSKTSENAIDLKEIKSETSDSAITNSNYTYQFPYVDSIPDPALQVSQFVRRIFQEKNGHLWFGTNGDGVARYNGEKLEYFSINEGFGIIQDENENLWFGTNSGLTKYDGESFTNYTEKNGLVNNDIWSMTIDNAGLLWIGTLQGVSLFDGKKFTPFILPESKPDFNRGVTSSKIVHSIMQDRKGNMWFGTNGGAYIYNGKSLTNLSEKDGLCNNAVNDILEDKIGNIWFATHYNGVCFWNGKTFTRLATKEREIGTEVWSLYEDKAGQIWFPIENFGIYRYNSNSLTNFDEKDGLTSGAIQDIFEDRQGNLWLGGYMGLFRYKGDSFYSISENGPW